MARHLIDIPQLAEHLGTTERHIRELVYRRDIPYVKVGRLVRFDVDAVAKWITDNTQEAAHAS